MAYKFKITLAKFGLIALEVIVAGIIAYAVEEPLLIGLVPFAEAIRNYLKHRKD